MTTLRAETNRNDIRKLVADAVDKRRQLIEPNSAIRLFNGFTEGCPDLALDQYGSTLVYHHFLRRAPADHEQAQALFEDLRQVFPFIKTCLVKDRFSANMEKRRGIIIEGAAPDTEIVEWGIPYSIHLKTHQDCTFYLDGALLRKWLIENAAGMSVLNTFAYTGSLGMAALAGGARHVVQTDLKVAWLNIFRETAALNQVQSERYEILPGDFFRVSSQLRHRGQLFDLVILDPPFFAKTDRGMIDHERNWVSLVNKIRPLVAHGGKIILVNNALYLSGEEMMQHLTEKLKNKYLSLGEIIPVPESFFGGSLNKSALPADPAPFNHSTKIITLLVQRKDGRTR